MTYATEKIFRFDDTFLKVTMINELAIDSDSMSNCEFQVSTVRIVATAACQRRARLCSISVSSTSSMRPRTSPINATSLCAKTMSSLSVVGPFALPSIRISMSGVSHYSSSLTWLFIRHFSCLS